MEYFEPIKKNSGWFVIPFFWLAYFIDYGVSHINDRTLESATFLNHNFVFGLKTVLTILLVTFVVMLLQFVLSSIAAYFQSNVLFAVVGIILLCFGSIALFKEMDIVPFKNINLFWHLGCLATGIWLFDFLGRLSKKET